MSSHNYKARLLFGLVLLAVPAWAQIEVGDNVSLSLNGNLGFGYSGAYGNTQLSNHSTGVNGDANLTGYYYNPNFLNFFVRPSYDRSQENSGNQSLTNATSINAGAGIFSGSHFPGSVSFGETFNSTGNFGLPGIESFTTHGNSSQFGIGWSELIPGAPPVSAQYSQTTSSATVFGSDESDHSASRNFNVRSNYNLDGWMMNARFADIHTSTQLPSFLTAGEFTGGDTNSKTFLYNANHKLPLQGSFSANYSYANFNGDGNGVETSGSNHSFAGAANFIPWSRVTSSFGIQYNTNLNGLVEQQLAGVGGIAPQVNFGSESHSLSFYNYDTISIVKNLSASVSFNRVQQEVFGQSISVNHFSAVANYRFAKPLWGALLIYGGVNDQSTDAGHQGTGLVTGASLTKRIKGFDMSGGFGYSQNVQTVLATQVTSDYTYLANVKRRFTRHLQWNANFHGFHSGLAQVAGSGSHSEGYGSNLLYRGYNLGFAYTKTYGTALLTAGGLVTPPTGIIPPTGNQYLLVNGSSFSISASANPIRRWSINSAFSKATSDTTTPTLTSVSSSKVYTAYTQYQLRKMSLTGGYTYLMQGLGSATGASPVNYSSFFVGIQRWFHPF